MLWFEGGKRGASVPSVPVGGTVAGRLLWSPKIEREVSALHKEGTWLRAALSTNLARVPKLRLGTRFLKALLR